MRKRMLAVGIVASALAAIGLCAWFITTNDLVPEPGFLAPKASEEVSQKASGDQRQVDWSDYPDSVIAWIEIPDTIVDYPVAADSVDDPGYYLTHDEWGGYDVYGVPYVAAISSEGLDSPSVIIYGHNMSDGTMFADLSRYKWADYAESHSVIYLYERDGDVLHELHVIGVNVIDADEEEARGEFKDSEELTAYLSQKLGESEVVFRAPSSVERLYTFVTCSYDTRNGRTLVYAIEEGGE